jgi:hypothetical protein
MDSELFMVMHVVNLKWQKSNYLLWMKEVSTTYATIALLYDNTDKLIAKKWKKNMGSQFFMVMFIENLE